MSLLWDSMTECVRLEKSDAVPDKRGGYIRKYTEGEHFLAAIVYLTEPKELHAQKPTVQSEYAVWVKKSETDFKLYDVFKRLSDNKIFRITSDSDDCYTPETASFQIRQFTAEEWELPND